MKKIINGSINGIRTEYRNKNGLYHREDGPALEFSDRKIWYFNGKFHRENDLPAFEDQSGHREWAIHGARHRDNGPAIIYSNGDKDWYKNGNRHRLDGPAVDWEDRKNWWLNGKHIPVSSQEEFERYLKLIAFH